MHFFLSNLRTFLLNSRTFLSIFVATDLNSCNRKEEEFFVEFTDFFVEFTHFFDKFRDFFVELTHFFVATDVYALPLKFLKSLPADFFPHLV